MEAKAQRLELENIATKILKTCEKTINYMSLWFNGVFLESFEQKNL